MPGTKKNNKGPKGSQPANSQQYKKEDDVPTSKFVAKLSNSDSAIKLERAVQEGSQAKTAVALIVGAKQHEVSKLEGDYMRLTDIGADSSTSLRPTADKNLDYKAWADKALELKLAIRIAKDELNDAQEFYAEWFGNE